MPSVPTVACCAHSTDRSLADFRDGPARVDLHQQTSFSEKAEERACLLRVEVQAAADRLLAVVVALG